MTTIAEYAMGIVLMLAIVMGIFILAYFMALVLGVIMDWLDEVFDGGGE